MIVQYFIALLTGTILTYVDHKLTLLEIFPHTAATSIIVAL
jgi:hypothetical protein